MRVILEMFGPLQRLLQDGQRRVELDIEDNITVGDLLARLGVGMDEPWNASLNGTLADPSDIVSEGSVLLVFPPIAGG